MAWYDKFAGFLYRKTSVPKVELGTVPSHPNYPGVAFQPQRTFENIFMDIGVQLSVEQNAIFCESIGAEGLALDANFTGNTLMVMRPQNISYNVLDASSAVISTIDSRDIDKVSALYVPAHPDAVSIVRSA
jgi:hypothetical protein